MQIVRKRSFYNNYLLVNPYVVNGLVSMWDGEWNARAGKHDDSLNCFKNIIAGRADLICGGLASWENNCAKINTALDYFFVDDVSKIGISELSGITVEIVFKHIWKTNDQNPLIFTFISDYDISTGVTYGGEHLRFGIGRHQATIDI